MNAAEGVNLTFVYCVNDFAVEEFGSLLPGHFAKRRNSPECSAEVLRISFFAFSMDIVRTDGPVRDGTLGGGGVRVPVDSLSMGDSLLYYYRSRRTSRLFPSDLEGWKRGRAYSTTKNQLFASHVE
jgi:hypothetical protein